MLRIDLGWSVKACFDVSRQPRAPPIGPASATPCSGGTP